MNTRRIYDSDTVFIEDIVFNILAKDVKRLSMRIDPTLGASITRPLYTSLEEAIEFGRANIDWARSTLQKMELKKPEQEKPYSPEERHAFMARVQRIFPKCESRMCLYASKVSIKLMNSRWGSCKKSTRAISLNLRLARKPDECLEYVIIHELAHIVHADHSQNFWDLVARYCPDWKRCRAILRNSNTQE